MGDDIYVSGEAYIRAANIPDATAMLRKLASDEDDAPNTDDLADLIERFSGEIYSGDVDTAGDFVICGPEDGCRNIWGYDQFLEKLAPFVADGDGFHYECCGDEEQRAFRNGVLVGNTAERVWNGTQADVDAFRGIIKIMYPKNKYRTKFPKGTLDKIAAIIKRAGRGPLAGLNDLEAVAKASED